MGSCSLSYTGCNGQRSPYSHKVGSSDLRSSPSGEIGNSANGRHDSGGVKCIHQDQSSQFKSCWCEATFIPERETLKEAGHPKCGQAITCIIGFELSFYTLRNAILGKYAYSSNAGFGVRDNSVGTALDPF